MTDLLELMRERRATRLPQHVVEDEPKPTVVMSVYDMNPTFALFGTVGASQRSINFDVGAEISLRPDELDFAQDTAQLVAALKYVNVAVAHVRGHEAQATTYVLPPNGALHRWYMEQRSAEGKYL
jgi:hypothetical protein